MSEVTRRVEAGEDSADGAAALRAPGPMDIERYLREAGYGEAYNYAVL